MESTNVEYSTVMRNKEKAGRGEAHAIVVKVKKSTKIHLFEHVKVGLKLTTERSVTYNVTNIHARFGTDGRRRHVVAHRSCRRFCCGYSSHRMKWIVRRWCHDEIVIFHDYLR